MLGTRSATSRAFRGRATAGGELARCADPDAVGPPLARDRADASAPAIAALLPSATSLTQPEDDRPNTFAAEVIDVAHRARGYDHVLRCGGTLLTAVFDTGAWARGEPCRVVLDPQGCVAFPVTAAEDAPADLTTVRIATEHVGKRTRETADG